MDNEVEKVIMDMYEYRDGQLSDVEIVKDIYKRLHESIDDVVLLKDELFYWQSRAGNDELIIREAIKLINENASGMAENILSLHMEDDLK